MEGLEQAEQLLMRLQELDQMLDKPEIPEEILAEYDAGIKRLMAMICVVLGEQVREIEREVIRG